MKVTAEVYWDKGARLLNQDSVSLQEVRIRGKKALFALVSDGIGGLQEGEYASGYVAEQMTEWFYKEGIQLLAQRKRRKIIEKAGLRALCSCNEELRRYGTRCEEKLGTTVTMLLLYKKRYILWHSGDTRAYYIRAKGIRKGQSCMKRLTTDHTRGNHTLIRCIGSFTWKEPDVHHGVSRSRSTILLCSDGFHNRIGEAQIAEAFHPAYVRCQQQLQKSMRQLGMYVSEQGETDNRSAIAVLIQ